MSFLSLSKINNQKLLNIIINYNNFEKVIDKKLIELTNINDKSHLLSEWYKILVKTEDILNNKLYECEYRYKFRKISSSTNSNTFMMTPNYKRIEYKYEQNQKVAINCIKLYNDYMKNIFKKKFYIEQKYIEIYPTINVSNFYNNNLNYYNGNNNNLDNYNGNNIYYGNYNENNNNGNNKKGNNKKGNNNVNNKTIIRNNNVNNKTIIRNNNTRTNPKQCCTISGGKKKKL